MMDWIDVLYIVRLSRGDIRNQDLMFQCVKCFVTGAHRGTFPSDDFVLAIRSGSLGADHDRSRVPDRFFTEGKSRNPSVVQDDLSLSLSLSFFLLFSLSRGPVSTIQLRTSTK